MLKYPSNLDYLQAAFTNISSVEDLRLHFKRKKAGRPLEDIPDTTFVTVEMFPVVWGLYGYKPVDAEKATHVAVEVMEIDRDTGNVVAELHDAVFREREQAMRAAERWAKEYNSKVKES